jgi:hypothetical protein
VSNPTTVMPAEPGTHEHLLPGARVVVPPRCPYSRSYSKYTGEYHLLLGHEDLTRIGELVEQAWTATEETFPIGEAIGDRFAAIMEHIESLRQWTGAPA